MNADALVKALSPFLGIDFLPDDLRRRGWFDFLAFDHPDTQDPVEMGYEAFVYLFDEEDDLAVRLHGLRRIVAFICGQNGHPMPSADAIREIARLLERPATDDGAIRAWFDRNCM